MRRAGFYLAVLTVALVAALAPLGGAATKPPIRIAAVLSLTGSGASLGVQEREGIQLRADQLNKAGGIKGRRIVLRFVDDQSSPDQAVQQTRALIQDYKPNAIIGGSISATCLAMKPVTEQAKVTQYCLSAAPIPQPAPYYFSAQSPFTRWIADVPVHWMVQNNIKSVGCLATNDSSGQLTLQVVKRAAESAGIKFSSQTFGLTDTDATPQLTRLRAENPDALYICTTGSAVVTALQGVRQLGFRVPVWISSGSASLPIAGLIKDILPEQGAFTSGSMVQTPTQVPKNHARRAIILRFATAYQAKYKKPADIFAASGNDALTILAKAFGNVPVNATPEDVTKYLEDELRLSGAQLSYNFQANDHRGTDVEGVIDRFTPEGGFRLVTVYQPGKIPRYSTR